MNIQEALNLIDDLMTESDQLHELTINCSNIASEEYYKRLKDEQYVKMQRYQELRDDIEAGRINY